MANLNDEKSARIGVLKLAILATCGFLALYLFYLQVIRGHEYAAKARSYAQQSVIIPASRGEIFDRNMDIPLVTNEEAFSIEVVPAEVPDKRREEIFSRLADVLGIKVSEIRKRIPPSYYRLYQPIQVSSAGSYSIITRIAERIEEYPGVYWNARPVRRYIDVGSISHILGYVGEIGRDEYKILYNQGYAQNDVVGKSGVERVYESVLKGRDGRLLKSVDVQGKDVADGGEKIETPVPGQSLVLTIDRGLQKIVERALGRRMGSAIVLKPSTGEILAMVSYPWFDPEIFASSGDGSEYARLLTDSRKPFLNRAIQSSYPPASTFKTVLSAAILQEKPISPLATVLCRGVIDYGGREWNCWVHAPGHGSVDLAQALAQSCDIYYWNVGRDSLGIETIASYASDFGYGKLTGIDLPGETAGFIPSPTWKEQTFNEKWTPGDTMNISIGQGYLLATPLQVADMMAMISNGGVAYKPHVLKEIRDGETGALVRSVEPEELTNLKLSPSTLQQLSEDLRGVVVSGSAHVPLSTKAVMIAGKTGTAEVGLKDRWHSWFASYGPYDAPPEDRIVVVTMVEATNPWEWWGPYAANVIYQAVFANQTADEAARSVGVSLDQTHQRGRAE